MKKYRAVVEDNNDPLKVGRVKVRIFGMHSSNNENSDEPFNNISTDSLPWAEVEGSTEFGLISGIGVSSVLRKGTWVWVRLDHDDFNKPIVTSTIKGVVSESPIGKYSGGSGFCDPDEKYPFTSRSKESDINRLARNEKLNDEYYDSAIAYGGLETIHNIINSNLTVVSISDGITGADCSQSEPISLSDLGEYPDIAVLETPGGNILEFDDTEGNERIRFWHKSGTYREVRPDGSIVEKQGTSGTTNHYIHISDVNEYIEKSVKRYIKENLEEIIGGNFLQNIKGNLKLHVEGNLDWNVDGEINIISGGNHTVVAPRIDLN